jgi:hypothetical protein
MEDPMKQKYGAWQNRAFIVAFFVLTGLCWSPLGYGVYGEVVRILGIPYWAVLALVWAAILCLVQWIYLFRTPWAMSDEQLPDLMAQLEAVDTKGPTPQKGNQ